MNQSIFTDTVLPPSKILVMSEQGAFDEIPATTINAISDFSPIKFSIKNEVEENFNFKDDNFQEITTTTTTTTTAIDEEITFVARKPCEDRLQRKSDEDICNTPKRERHDDQNLNIRSGRLLSMDEDKVNEDCELMKTPKKKGEIVKSLSIEFEQRLASIHVSPRPNLSNTSASNTVDPVSSNNTTNTTTTNSTSTNNSPCSKPVRSMSPIRSIAQLSPVSKLNLNDDQPAVAEGENTTFNIETPKLVSPSKIVAAGSAVEIEKIKNEIESKVKNRFSVLFMLFCSGLNKLNFYNLKFQHYKKSTKLP